MSPDDRKRAYRKDLCSPPPWSRRGWSYPAPSLTEIRPFANPQMAQATPPLQSTPGAENKPSAPAEPVTTGQRPTEIPPQPARPDAEAQKAGATPALPPAPAEKIAPPIKEK